MKGGFSFCGIDIGTIGLEYAPELEDTYVYRSAKSRIHEQTWDGHNGGYYYGASKEPKEFVLRCIFEETEIDYGIMAKVGSFFRVGKSGKLVFGRRPWCYYQATVTDLDLTGITNYLNGVIKITMKAYYPFARSDRFIMQIKDGDYNRMAANTAFAEKAEMIPETNLCINGPVVEHTDFYLFNPGNEFAAVGIEIAGNVGQGVTITNHTTKQTCRFVAMSETVFDGETSYVYADGLNGKTIAVKDGSQVISFLYHDAGFIQLAPAFPAKRNVRVSAKGNEVQTVERLFDRTNGETREDAAEQYVGKHIWLDNHWYKILDVGKANLKDVKNEHLLIIDGDIKTHTGLTTMICQLNQLSVEPDSEMKLTRLNFIYKPTFS